MIWSWLFLNFLPFSGWNVLKLFILLQCFVRLFVCYLCWIVEYFCFPVLSDHTRVSTICMFYVYFLVSWLFLITISLPVRSLIQFSEHVFLCQTSQSTTIIILQLYFKGRLPYIWRALPHNFCGGSAPVPHLPDGCHNHCTARPKRNC